MTDPVQSTDKSTGNQPVQSPDNSPGTQSVNWAGLALAVVLAATLFRILVIVSSPLPLFFDEAQYWVWAQDFAFGYYSKPPFIAWAIAGTTAVCGDGEACVRLSAPLFHGATAMLVFLIARRFYDATTGFWASISYVVLPGVSLSAVIVSTDVYLLFFWALAFLSIKRAEETDAWRWWLLFGFALGFGLLSKYAMVFFILGLCFDAVWRRPQSPMSQRPRFWAAIGLGALLYLPNLWWNWVNDFPSYRHTGENMNLGSDFVNPIHALEFFGSQLGVFGPIMFVSLAWIVLARIGRSSGRGVLDDRQKTLLAFCLPVLGVILLQAFLSRAHANWAATAYITATVVVVGELMRLNKVKWVKLSLGVHIVAAALFYNFDLVVRTLDVPITPDLDPARRMRGWDQAGDWVEGLQRELPDNVGLLFDDRKVMSELMYYVQPHPFDAVMWNPKGQSNNHYEMATDLSQFIGQDFLYVIRHDWPGRASPRFEKDALLATFRSRAYTGGALELRAYVLKGFKGYAP